MSKNSYFYNSSKLLIIASILLFVSYLLTTVLGFLNITETFFANLTVKFSNLVMYVFPVLVFIALNGEGIGHKRAREPRAKKATSRFKWYLFFVFLFLFLKAGIQSRVLKTNPLTPAGALTRIGVSVVFVLLSYGGFLLFFAIWCRVRDKADKTLSNIENVVIAISLIYGFYKLFNNAISVFDVNFVGDSLGKFFSSQVILKTLCLLQYGADIVMFFMLNRKFSAIVASEQVETDDKNKTAVIVRTLFENEGFGLDTADDKWALQAEDNDEDDVQLYKDSIEPHPESE